MWQRELNLSSVAANNFCPCQTFLNWNSSFQCRRFHPQFSKKINPIYTTSLPNHSGATIYWLRHIIKKSSFTNLSLLYDENLLYCILRQMSLKYNTASTIESSFRFKKLRYSPTQSQIKTSENSLYLNMTYTKPQSGINLRQSTGPPHQLQTRSVLISAKPTQ